MIEAQMPNLFGPQSLPDPTGIVLHGMGEIIEQGKHDVSGPDFLIKMEWSAHRYITPSGIVIQARPDRAGAWHCRANKKNYTAWGVEFLVEGVHDIFTLNKAMRTEWLTKKQFDAGVELMRFWISLAPGIDPHKHITGHMDEDPTRKEDPGPGFPKTEFLNAI